MKRGGYVEKRRSKRIDLSIPVILRKISGKGKVDEQEGLTLNVSYNGAYLININLKDIRPEETLHISLSVPRDETRDFPFSRIVGNVRVARVEKDGIGLEFGEDISRLFVAN